MWRAARVLALFGAAACGGAGAAVDGGPALDLVAAVGDLSAPADLGHTTLPNGYPGPPYGARVGDVLQDFTFMGWYTPDATTGLATDAANGAIYASVSLNDTHRSGKKFALIMLAGFL